ncbi:unnamed protein product [Rotaria sp. Silwood2]|nr:unnamed protein product [Rotaria sp. Silwood2]CAF4248837.1 unnamed protein product [Rotaria sp. Silwood2]
MLTWKSLKKIFGSTIEQGQRTSTHKKSSIVPKNNVVLNKNHVDLLIQWLNQLNEQNLIAITEQNDIVIMVNGHNNPAQQIFVNHDDIDAYMKTKANNDDRKDKSEVISMHDIARILLKNEYVNESLGQYTFNTQTIKPDKSELEWLKSIIHSATPDLKSRETQVKLYDGSGTWLLCIPWEYMAPTEDVHAVANYLCRNGHIRYDIDSGTYVYRYVEPDILLDGKVNTPERIAQRQMLSIHIRHVHVDEKNKRIEVEFLDPTTKHLIIPSSWYQQIFTNNFDRNYIIDALLANNGIIDHDAFVFMGNVYSLKVPRVTKTKLDSTPSQNLKTTTMLLTQKNELIRRYVNFIIEQGGIKYDNRKNLFILENTDGGRQVYFTKDHSQWIRQNRCRRLDVIYVLVKHGQIIEDQSNNLLLYYNHQFIRLPSKIIQSSTFPLYNSDYTVDSSNRPLYRSKSSTITSSENDEARFRNRLSQELQEDSLTHYHNTIDYMCRHNLVTWDKHLQVIKLHFTDQTLFLPIDHLQSIIDFRVLSSVSTSDNVLPFTSRQLSEWLLKNSYMNYNIR